MRLQQGGTDEHRVWSIDGLGILHRLIGGIGGCSTGPEAEQLDRCGGAERNRDDVTFR
jgi:hypothetical protein